MVTYPLDEVLLATLFGRAGRTTGTGWRRSRLGHWTGCAGSFSQERHPDGADVAQGVPQALQRGFAAWAATLRAEAREVIAVDGKTPRGSKTSPDGKGALHVVSAYATAAGLVLAQRAVDGKSKEIPAIQELLDMLNPKGAIVTIDAMGTQKEIAGRIAQD